MGSFYDKKREIQIEYIFKQLELAITPNQIFDLSDDGSSMRLNEARLANYILKELHEKKKLFNDGDWVKRILLPTDTIFWLLNDKDQETEVAYLENKENSVDIPFKRVLELCQLVSPVQDKLKKWMIDRADKSLELEKAIENKDYAHFINIIETGYPSLEKVKMDNTLFS